MRRHTLRNAYNIPVHIYTQKNAHCRYIDTSQAHQSKKETIREFVFISNALANGISCFFCCFCCMSPCRVCCSLFFFRALPSRVSLDCRHLATHKACSFADTNDFNLYQKHSIVWRGPRFNQHLQNRFLLKEGNNKKKLTSFKVACCVLSLPSSAWFCAAKILCFQKLQRMMSY